MENSIRINSSKLPIREYKGQRVVTFKEIDTVHGRPEGTARKRFNDNKERFIEGVDYFVRKTDEARREYGITAPNGLILITESGYLMLAKSFTDDLAWQVQRELVNNYFRGKTPEPEQLTLETSEYHYFPKTFNGEPVITVADFVHFTGVTTNSVYKALPKNCITGTDYLLLEYRELVKFKAANRIPSKRTGGALIVIKKSGVEKLLGYYDCMVDIPMIEEKKQPVKVKEPSGFVRPSSSMESLMGYVQREARAIEGVANMLLCVDTRDNFENYRALLIDRIKFLRDYCFDIECIKI